MTNATMRKAWGGALPAAVVLSVLALAVARAGQEPAPAAPRSAPVVGVVDMGRVLRGSRQWRDAVEKRGRMVERGTATLKKLSAQVQTLRNDYESQPPGTDERRQKAADLKAAIAGLERQRTALQVQMARYQAASVRDLLRRLTVAVAEHAEQNGISLVLKKQDMALDDPESAGQSLQIATSEVLYANASLDITDAIVSKLNAAYSGPIEAK